MESKLKAAAMDAVGERTEFTPAIVNKRFPDFSIPENAKVIGVKFGDKVATCVEELPAGYLHLPTKPIEISVKYEPELTDWISGDILPTIDGVYERDYSSVIPSETIGYALFKNGNWATGYRKVDSDSILLASQVDDVSQSQNLPWRGLAKNPEVKK